MLLLVVLSLVKLHLMAPRKKKYAKNDITKADQ